MYAYMYLFIYTCTYDGDLIISSINFKKAYKLTNKCLHSEFSAKLSCRIRIKHIGRSRFTRFYNLHHLSNLCNNFQFNASSHRQFVTALVFCRNLAENGITLTPTVTLNDGLRW
jgi:hypothetical protein